MNRGLWITASLFAALWARPVAAQISARGLAMGGAYTAVARGHQASVWNPANLGLSDNPAFSLNILGACAGGWNNSFSMAVYEKYNGVFWSARDIEDILEQVPRRGLEINARSYGRILGVSSRRMALFLDVTAGLFSQVDKEILALGLTGSRMGDSYQFQNLDGNGMGYATLGLSWGHPVPTGFADEFTLGMTLKLHVGLGAARLDRSDLEMEMNPWGARINGSYSALIASPVNVWDDGDAKDRVFWAVGYGYDLGAAARFNQRWTISLICQNMVSDIPWESMVSRQESGVWRGDSLTVVMDEDFQDTFQDSTWSVRTSHAEMALPMTLRFGASYQEGDYLISMEYVQGLTEGPLGTIRPRFSVGTEWSPVSWMPLRLGYVLGGRMGFASAFGLGFHAGGLCLDLGFLTHGFFSSGSSKGVMAAVDLGLNIGKTGPSAGK